MLRPLPRVDDLPLCGRRDAPARRKDNPNLPPLARLRMPKGGPRQAALTLCAVSYSWLPRTKVERTAGMLAIPGCRQSD
jgi:hypothetical protein